MEDDFQGGGLFGDSDDEPKKTDICLYNSGENDSDVDRPPLTEADLRRKANKQRSKVKQRLTLEEIEEFKQKNEQKKKESELKKKNKKLWQQMHGKSQRQPENGSSYPRGIDRDERKRLTREARENKTAVVKTDVGPNLAEQKLKSMQQQKEQILQILKDVQEDPNFKAFYELYNEKQKEAMQMEKLQSIKAENDYGNCEYKLKLDNPTLNRVDHLTTQMIFRLNEGFGRAMYRIGVEDNGVCMGINEVEMKETLSILFYMARNQNAEIEVEKVRQAIQNGSFMAEITINRNILENMKQGIKITMLGCEAAGKSTLIGVLISGQKDDGKGLARVHVHKHYSEIIDGKTTSMYQHILGFNSNGEITNLSKFGNLSWPQIMEDSSKVITFIDVGGNERYAKTLVRGLCANFPDYALIVVDAEACAANKNIEKNILDNFRIAFAFQVPVIICLTKIDCISDQNLLEDIIYDLRTEIWHIAQKVGNVIYNEKDIILINRQMQSQIVCPIFKISNKTHQGIELFKNFLNNLQFSNKEDNLEKQAYGGEFHISQTYKKTKENLILAGIVHKGKFCQNQKTLLGPNNEGTFSVVEIKSIHSNRVPVQVVKAGQMCSILIYFSKFSEKWLRQAGGDIRKGMVLLDYKDKINVEACFSFKADIWSFDGTTQTMKSTFQPFIHTQQVSQTCAIFFEDDIELARLNAKKKILKSKRNKSTEHKKIRESSSEKSSDYDCDESRDKLGKFVESPMLKRKLGNLQMSAGRQRAYSSEVDLITSLGQPSTFGSSTAKKSEEQKDIADALSPANENTKEIQEIQILPNKKTTVFFQFLYNPEYIGLDNNLIINMENFKAFGKITQLITDKIQDNHIKGQLKQSQKSQSNKGMMNLPVTQKSKSYQLQDYIKEEVEITPVKNPEMEEQLMPFTLTSEFKATTMLPQIIEKNESNTSSVMPKIIEKQDSESK